MQIDRQQFLLLASAIAASCGGKQPPPTTGGALVVISGPEPTALEPWKPPPPAPPQEAPPPPTHEGGATPLPPDSGMCRAQASSPPSSAASCTAGPGRPGSCVAVNLPGGCRGFAFICDKCESYKTHFKPAVAERAVACVTAQTQQQLQDGCGTYRCGDEALQSACHDPSARGPCRAIAQQCGASLSECTQMLSGMNAAGRAAVAACAARGCEFGFWSCIEGM